MNLLVALLNGVVYGLLLFMVSSGLTLVFGMMGVLNFAHASFYMLGAFAGFVASKYLGFWWGLLAATLFVGLAGLAAERGLLARVRRFGHTHELLLTFGLAFVIQEGVKLLFGPLPVAYRIPEELRQAAFTLGGVPYPWFRVVIGGVALLMFVVLYAILGLTRIGIVIRAAVQAPQMVAALGHNVPVVFSGLFAVGVAMAGLGGAVSGVFYPTSSTMAVELGSIVFVVVVVGGLGSLNGALAASLLVGLLTSFAVSIDVSLGDLGRALGMAVDPDARGMAALSLSSIAGVLPYALMLVVLLFRPGGLAGGRL